MATANITINIETLVEGRLAQMIDRAVIERLSELLACDYATARDWLIVKTAQFRGCSEATASGWLTDDDSPLG